MTGQLIEVVYIFWVVTAWRWNPEFLGEPVSVALVPCPLNAVPFGSRHAKALA